MIRFIDIILSLVGLLIFLPILLLLFLINYFFTRSPLFFQKRVGIYKKEFLLIKFRTMKIETKDVRTHFLTKKDLTPFGSFLRTTKLDELPQLWNVLLGDMSIVGPRPALANDEELIRERDFRGIFNYRPGITGLAQINGIDMSDPIKLAIKDHEMISTLNLVLYFKLIFLTVLGHGSGDKLRN